MAGSIGSSKGQGATSRGLFIEKAFDLPLWRLGSQLRAAFIKLDPRIPVACVLFSYLVLGLTVLGFDRSWTQILITSSVCCFLEVFFQFVFTGRVQWPLSALITSFSLSFLLNYSQGSWMILLPPLIAIGSKYALRWQGRHFFNPALTGVSVSLIISRGLITSAPAYQWNGIAALWIYVLFLGLFFVVLKVPRTHLIVAFLMTYALQTALRAFIMKNQLPFETLFWGTLSSPSFLIFSLFMITDPPTSPEDPKAQIRIGGAIALLDLFYHLHGSYYTFFFAAFTLTCVRFAWLHLSRFGRQGVLATWRQCFVASGYWRQPVVVFVLGASLAFFYNSVVYPNAVEPALSFKFEQLPPEITGLDFDSPGDLLDKVDPRVQHIAKWYFAQMESIAVGDVNGDGLPDIFVTQPLKATAGRALLYLNRGKYRFEKVEIPALNRIINHPETEGVITQAILIDYDNDGATDIFLNVVHGHPILLQSQLLKTGRLEFKDVTHEVGLDRYYLQSISATFADFNRDGLLDLFVANVVEENLPDYDPPEKLNFFHLPESRYTGDRRMFNFMQASWNRSDNGGHNMMFFQKPDHTFELQDAAKWGGAETRWSFAVGAVSLKNDGYPDLYVANDFGPDEVYYNRHGQRFEQIKDAHFGGIGNDTYKGMNVSVADFDHTGWFSVYVSSIHHALQAEGSLLWAFSPGESRDYPAVRELATKRGLLNEERFGWGADAADFDNDGWVDLAQANGMVDDRFDKKYQECPDYWYINEKIARSPSDYHRFADKWGDLRGYCVYGHEQNRIYLNRGLGAHPQFVDVASQVGVTELGNSRAAVAGDFTNSGRLDLIFSHPFARQTFYKNVEVLGPGKSSNSWIGFDLRGNGVTCNRDAIGTRVELEVEAQSGAKSKIAAEVQAVSGFLGQSDKRLHFGLGPRPRHVTATISWCGEKSTTVPAVMNVYNKLAQD